MQLVPNYLLFCYSVCCLACGPDRSLWSWESHRHSHTCLRLLWPSPGEPDCAGAYSHCNCWATRGSNNSEQQKLNYLLRHLTANKEVAYINKWNLAVLLLESFRIRLQYRFRWGIQTPCELLLASHCLIKLHTDHNKKWHCWFHVWWKNLSLSVLSCSLCSSIKHLLKCNDHKLRGARKEWCFADTLLHK